MSSTSTSTAASVSRYPVSHVPTPFAYGSPQVSDAGGSTSGGASGGSGGTTTTPTGTAASASALVFTATCQASDALGAVVRSNGSATAVVSVTNGQPYPAVGIIIAKSSDTACTVQTYGLCTGVLSGLVPNTRYFAGASGKPVLIASALSGAFLQLIGFAVASNAIFIQPRGDLFQLSGSTDASGNNVSAAPSSDGTALLYGGVLTSTEPPTADLGQVGDSLFQYPAAGGILLWGPKSAEAGWGTAGQSLVGAAGNRIYVRDTDPDTSVTPAVGDVWINRQTGQLFDAA